MSLIDVAHDFVVRLFSQSLEGLHHGQTGVNHRRQLPGEDNQVGKWDFSACRLAFFSDFLLDGNDQQVAVQQRGDCV